MSSSSSVDVDHETERLIATPLIFPGDGNNTSRDAFPLHRQPSSAPYLSVVKMGLLTLAYLVAGGLLPFYNKILLAGWKPVDWSGFNYPLTTTTVQLVGFSLVLAVYELIAHWCWLPRQASWAFARRNGARKLRLLAGPGFLFALVISFSNIGLVRPPLTVHLLLRSSELWWTMVAALAIRRELPTLVSFLCCLAVAVGAALVSAEYAAAAGDRAAAAAAAAAADHHHHPQLVTWDIVFNLGSALFSGLLLAWLRDSCVRLRAVDPSSRVLEATLIKTVVASVLVAAASLVFERDGWQALAAQQSTASSGPPVLYLLLSGGLCLTLTYQALVVALATFSYAVSVGLLAQCKIVPQIPVAYWVFHKQFDPHPLRIVGLALVLLGAIVYTVERIRKSRRQQQLRQ